MKLIDQLHNSAICVVCGNRHKLLEPGFNTCKGCTTEADREQEARERLRNGEPRITPELSPALANPAPRLPLVVGDVYQGEQLSPAPGTFVDLPQRIQRHWGDGADEKNRAILELDAATANVANLAQVFCDRSGGILDGERLGALRDACKDRRAKQEAFLRAMANQSPQTAASADHEASGHPRY